MLKIAGRTLGLFCYEVKLKHCSLSLNNDASMRKDRSVAMCPHFLEENEILLHVGQCLKDKVQIPKKE